MMEKKPESPQMAPYVMELEEGRHWWCACGKSKNQPFCDGSHKGSGFSPVKLELSEKKKVALCGCKHTGNPPFCDGTHKKLK
jgi:CDGSH-type Zn-finger protein